MAQVKHWARLRKHGPCLIFDWHDTEAQARQTIHQSYIKHEGDKQNQVLHMQTVAFFPDGHRIEE